MNSGEQLRPFFLVPVSSQEVILDNSVQFKQVDNLVKNFLKKEFFLFIFFSNVSMGIHISSRECAIH